MPYCRNCGVQLPEDAVFCPNCGAPVEVKAQYTPEIKETALRYLFIGLVGAFLSVMIDSFSSTSNTNLYFVPSFVSSIFIIYVYRIRGFKESLITTFTVYLFADGILGALILGYCYAFNTPYKVSWTPKIWEVILYSFNPISAFIAAYIGARISPKRGEEPVIVPYKREEEPGGVIYNL